MQKTVELMLNSAQNYILKTLNSTPNFVRSIFDFYTRTWRQFSKIKQFHSDDLKLLNRTVATNPALKPKQFSTFRN